MSSYGSCNDYGGNWSDGQPNPTHTWHRSQGNCNKSITQQYEQQELDMRRKAEVLLYKNNTTNWTKKQRFAYLAKNPNKFIRQNPATNSCSTTQIAYNPASASDVPGNTSLYYNPSIPLLNWRVQRVQTNAGGINVAQYKIACTNSSCS